MNCISYALCRSIQAWWFKEFSLKEPRHQIIHIDFGSLLSDQMRQTLVIVNRHLDGRHFLDIVGHSYWFNCEGPEWIFVEKLWQPTSFNWNSVLILIHSILGISACVHFFIKTGWLENACACNWNYVWPQDQIIRELQREVTVRLQREIKPNRKLERL